MDMIKLLSKVPLFKGLSKKNLEDLSLIAIERKYLPAKRIFWEKDESTGFYVIVSGSVKIFKISSEGKEQILHFFGPGDPFGEITVFTGKRFPASAEAVVPSTILFFPRKHFISLIKKDPSLSLNMLGILSQRLHDFTSLIEDLSLKEVPGRLAAYLLYMSEKQNGLTKLQLDLSKGQLASLLGTIPETLSRILRKMINHRLIITDARRIIEIVDKKKLEELAHGDRRLS